MQFGADSVQVEKSNVFLEHTLLVTEDGVEILTARKEDSPGGPVNLSDVTVSSGKESGSVRT